MNVEIFALGDWGAPLEMSNEDDVARVHRLQNMVARGMADYAKQLAADGRPLTAVFGLGDNFYGGLSGPKDVRFKERFEELYDPVALAAPFYFVLGNHDYEDKPRKNWLHEIAYAKDNPSSRWKWPAAEGATWFRKDFPLGDSVLTAVCLDTNTDHAGAKWDEQMAFLRAEMAAAQSSHWRIVIAHHPMWTDGYHWDGKKDPDLYPKIRKSILPEIKSAVFYISAHDHNLQHIRHKQHPETDFFISGAGGGDFVQKRRLGDVTNYTNEFFESCGFLHLSFTPDEARAQFVVVEKDGWKLVGAGAVRGRNPNP